MFSSNKGGILTIDEQGSIIHDEPLGDLQNAAEYSYKDGIFIAGGRRHNTHLIIGKNSKSKLIHLLWILITPELCRLNLITVGFLQ